MSTFGNKALRHWDYEFTDSIRFNRTPHDMQLKILEKWYPVGMEVTMINHSQNSLIYIVSGYSKRLYGYMVETIYDGVTITIHPSRIRPSENWLRMNNRENKLNDILK